jgi:hypothetical protein
MEKGDEGYKRAVSGLLRKRNEILADICESQERVGQSKNDLESIERCLALLGHEGELPTQKSKATRVNLYYRNEIRSFVRKQLSESETPLTTRELAERLIEHEGRDANDRRIRSDLIRRIGSSLYKMRNDGAARSEKNGSEVLWRLM